MPLAIISVLVILLKVADVEPVARWSWFWVLVPFFLLMLWWNVIAPMVGWDKKMAEKKMRADQAAAQELKKKTRGF